MKTIEYTKIKITNFKGIESFEADLSPKMTVSGDNKLGKTSIFVDAIQWLWFGKNGNNQEKFSIKNTVNTSLNRMDHSVELHFTVNGIENTAKRIYCEDWTTTRGTGEVKLSGHITKYEWNGVPLGSASEYQKKVADIMEDSLFKMTTNLRYFNSEMSKDERRNTLIKMASEVTDEKVINGNAAFRNLMDSIANKKSLKEYGDEIKAKITRIRKEKADIEPGIKAIRGVTPQSENWEEIEKEKATKQEAIKRIDTEIEAINLAYDGQKKLIKAQQDLAIIATRKMGEIENQLTQKAYSDAAEANKSLNDAKYQLTLIRDQIKAKKTRLSDLQQSIANYTTAREKLLADWHKEDEKQLVFDDSNFVCPTCKRVFEADDVDMKKADMHLCFRTEKDQNLAKITSAGKVIKGSLELAQKETDAVKQEIAELQFKEESYIWSETAVAALPKPVKPQLEKHTQYLAYKAETEKVIDSKPPDVSEQTDTRAQIQESIDALNKILSKRETIQTNEAKISDMLEKEKQLAQEIASMEKVEMTIADFNKAKITMVEEAVNGRFSLVKFRLFEKQLNGGEFAVCDVMVDGVPFNDLNHASQINAGIDCASALQKFYGISAPLVVDNAEAVNELIHTDCQLIRLVVTKDPQIVITNN